MNKEEANKNTCADCGHFVRHYVKDGYRGRFAPINRGHCVYPRTKNREANMSACKDYEREVNTLGEMKKVFDEYFSFTEEEKKWLALVAEDLLNALKKHKLTVREALYVINKCEHAVFLEGIGEGFKDE